MDIVCIGADPAGLYFAATMKRQFPDHRVRIIDMDARSRNPAPPHILCNPLKPDLRLSDNEVAAQLLQASSLASGVIVRRGAEAVRTADKSYRIMAAEELESLLARRAKSAGCEFSSALSSDPLPDADLIIAADGASSPTRKRYEKQFGAVLDKSAALHAIFETEAPIQGLVHSFQQARDGVFQAILYPSAGGLACVLVEARPETLASAGLNDAGSAAAEFLTSLFSADLAGHCLRPKSMDWRPFVTVRSASWSADNIFLLGEAAYAAHFSIGLAARTTLEDADALAAALVATDRDAAFAKAVSERRPVADSLLRAARASLTWREHPARYLHMPFEQFAYSYLTRSMRVTHAHLQTSAPELVRKVERLIAGPALAGKTVSPPPMMAPFRLGSLDLPNRIVMSPMCMYAANDGTVNDFHLVHLGSRAIGGAGLIITEMTDVSPEGRISLHCAGMYAPEHVSAWRRITDFVHERSAARIGIQLGHAGRKGSLTRSWEGHRPLDESVGWRTLAPSAIAFDDDRPAPKEMTRADMDRIRDAYVAATKMSDEAGFDMIEIHMAHGYLLSSFISPVSNRRADRYGGALENRARFPLEIFRAVREAWPSDKPISTRISAVDWISGGTTIQDAIALSRMLREAGNDIICASTGGITSARRPMVGRLYQTTFSDQIRNELRIPTMAVGGIASYSDANTIVAAGRADLCALARGYLYDPYFVRHAAHRQGFTDLRWPSEYRGADQLPILDC